MIKTLSFVSFYFCISYCTLGQVKLSSSEDSIYSHAIEIPAVSRETTLFEKKQHPHYPKTLAAASIQGTVTDAYCHGTADGSIAYTLTGGQLPYTYQWSNGPSGTVYGDCWNIITLNNPGSSTLNDYQVMITMPYSPGMNTDFSDLRFSDTSNTTLYAYWREDYEDATRAIFWIKVPSIPPGNSFLRASYCDPNALSLSNGLNTFEYFEDFDDQVSSDWTHQCLDVDQIDETCDTATIPLSSSGYGLRLKSYAHCTGLPINGVRNRVKKNISIPPGQYKIDVDSYFRICLRNICADSARIYSSIYVNNSFASIYFLMRKNTCGCNISNGGFIQIRSNAFTTTTTTNEYSLRTDVTTCGEGEMVYNDYRIRKFEIDPIVTIGPQENILHLNNLRAGNYTITVTAQDGNSSMQTFTVKEPALPTVADVQSCGRSPFYFTANGPYLAMNWYSTPVGGTALSSFTSTYTSDTLIKNTVFYVSGIGSNGCESKPRIPASAIVVLPDGSNECLKIYTGISPNNDGLNDEWVIEGIEKYPINRVYIYDRWGNIVFEQPNYNNSSSKIWKGISNKNTFKAEELPNGTYFYEIDMEGLSKPLSGFVIINREK